jgi:predicted transcriptional regulator
MINLIIRNKRLILGKNKRSKLKIIFEKYKVNSTAAYPIIKILLNLNVKKHNYVFITLYCDDINKGYGYAYVIEL